MVRLTLSTCLFAVSIGWLVTCDSRNAGAAEPRSGSVDVHKPPRPQPIDGSAVLQPAAPERKSRSPRKKQSAAKTSPIATPVQAGDTISRPKPSTDRTDVRNGAREFCSLVDRGQVRLLSSERDRAQVESLRSTGIFQWIAPIASQNRLGQDIVAPDTTDAVEPDADTTESDTRNTGDRGTGRAALPNSGGTGDSGGRQGGNVPVRAVKAAPISYFTEPPGELFQMLNSLASRSTETKPLVITSLLRPPFKTARYAMQSPANPHALGYAVDISGFGGHSILNSAPEEEVQAVLELLRSLAPGRYRMGLPKAPEPIHLPDTGISVPGALGGGTSASGAASDSGRQRGTPPLPSRGGRRQDTRTSSSAQRDADTDSKFGQGAASASSQDTWPFFPAPQKGIDAQGKPVTRFANEHYADEQYINDPRITKALLEARRHGVDVYALFPDGVNHVHIDVKPTM